MCSYCLCISCVWFWFDSVVCFFCFYLWFAFDCCILGFLGSDERYCLIWLGLGYGLLLRVFDFACCLTVCFGALVVLRYYVWFYCRLVCVWGWVLICAGLGWGFCGTGCLL